MYFLISYSNIERSVSGYLFQVRPSPMEGLRRSSRSNFGDLYYSESEDEGEFQQTKPLKGKNWKRLSKVQEEEESPRRSAGKPRKSHSRYKLCEEELSDLESSENESVKDIETEKDNENDRQEAELEDGITNVEDTETEQNNKNDRQEAQLRDFNAQDVRNLHTSNNEESASKTEPFEFCKPDAAEEYVKVQKEVRTEKKSSNTFQKIDQSQCKAMLIDLDTTLEDIRPLSIEKAKNLPPTLQKKILDFIERLGEFEKPTVLPVCTHAVEIDFPSLALGIGATTKMPVKCPATGDSLYSSVAIALFGSDDRKDELRLRAALAYFVQFEKNLELLEGQRAWQTSDPVDGLDNASKIDVAGNFFNILALSQALDLTILVYTPSIFHPRNCVPNINAIAGTQLFTATKVDSIHVSIMQTTFQAPPDHDKDWPRTFVPLIHACFGEKDRFFLERESRARFYEEILVAKKNAEMAWRPSSPLAEPTLSEVMEESGKGEEFGISEERQQSTAGQSTKPLKPSRLKQKTAKTRVEETTIGSAGKCALTSTDIGISHNKRRKAYPSIACQLADACRYEAYEEEADKEEADKGKSETFNRPYLNTCFIEAFPPHSVWWKIINEKCESALNTLPWGIVGNGEKNVQRNEMN